MGGGLYFYRMKSTPYELLRKGGYVGDIGAGAFFEVKTNPTEALYWTLDPNVCRTCKTRIFANCKSGHLPDGDRRLRLMLAADGSEMAAAPRKLAIALASQLGVTLDVAGVVTHAEQADAVAARLAAIRVAGVAADVSCELITRQGNDLAHEIHAAALAAHTQLLVIGRRVMPDTAKELGPVAQRILATAPCHVLVVTPDAHLWQRRILVPFDGSDAAMAACDLAGQLAKPAQLPVTLFSVSDRKGNLPQAIDDAAQLAIATLKLEGIAGELLVRQAGIADGILAAAEETQADLIVLYRHTRGGLSRKLLGSVSEEVIRRARIPVLLVGAATKTADDQIG
jgi:SulP family sulfate permease